MPIPEPMIEELAGSCHTALERHRRVGGSFCCTSRETLAIVGPYQFRARRAGTPSFVSVDVSRALAFDPEVRSFVPDRDGSLSAEATDREHAWKLLLPNR